MGSALYLNWPDVFGQGQGGDFQRSATGSMLVATGTTLAAQKLIRWLLTNPRVVLPDGRVLKADYIFNALFGVGLRRRIGSDFSKTATANSREFSDVKALIVQGCQAIDEIAKVPAPTINIAPATNGIVITVYYTDAQTNRPRSISFTVPSTS